MKAEIISRLNQSDVLLPSLIAEGLFANERAKVRLSVLQAAGRHARDPGKTSFDLAVECSAAGIDSAAMEALVNRASIAADGRVTAPGLAELATRMWDDVVTMIVPVKAEDPASCDAVFRRLSAIRETAGLASLSDMVELD